MTLISSVKRLNYFFTNNIQSKKSNETNDEYCDEIIEIEKKVFWIMIGLIKHRELKGIWSPGIKALKLRTVQFYKLLDKKMPLYRKYFNQLNIDGFFFTSQWYLTIFSYVLIHDMCLKIDCSFEEINMRSLAI